MIGRGLLISPPTLSRFTQRGSYLNGGSLFFPSVNLLILLAETTWMPQAGYP